MIDDLLDLLLGEPGPDPGCEAVFEQLDRYCEAVRAGADVEREFADVVRHLRNCITCREDTEGLLALLEREEAGGT